MLYGSNFVDLYTRSAFCWVASLYSRWYVASGSAVKLFQRHLLAEPSTLCAVETIRIDLAFSWHGKPLACILLVRSIQRHGQCLRVIIILHPGALLGIALSGTRTALLASL